MLIFLSFLPLLMLTVVTLSLLKYWAIIIACICHVLDSCYFCGVCLCLLHQTDTFQVEAVSLGKLQKVLLRCEASEESQYWYCEKVVVREPGTATESVFTCER